MSGRASAGWAWIACGVSVLAFAQTNAPAPGPRTKAKASTPAVTSAPVEGDTSLGLRFPLPGPFRSAPDTEFALPNGARAAVSENREIPLVTMYVLVGAGSSNDPAGKAGLAEATARVVRSGGTESLSGAVLTERLEKLQATIEAAVSDSETRLMLQAPRAGFEAAAGILRDLLVAPRLDPEAVDSTLGQLYASVGERYQNPLVGLTAAFRRQLYGPDSARARQYEYTSIDSLRRSDLEAFHRRYYSPQGAVVAIEGDIAAADARALTERLLSTWKPGGEVTPGLSVEPTAPIAISPAILFADRQDLRMAAFVAGHAGGRLNDPDYAAMLVVCELLANGSDSRLATRVREAGGWRADWTANWDAAWDRPGEFTVRAVLDAPFITQSITILREEISKLREGNITEADVARVRTRLLSRLAVGTQATSEQARDRAVARFHGLSVDLRTKTLENLAAMTRDTVARAAAARLQTEHVIAVTGSSTLFDKQLGMVTTGKVIPIDLTAPAQRRLETRVDAESLARGKQLLASLQQALGGRAKLEGIRDMSVRWQGTAFVSDRVTDIKVWERWSSIGVLRQDQDLGFRQQSIFYDGKIAWIGTRGAVAALPREGLLQMRNELFRMLFRLALSDANPARQVADLGGNVIEINEGEQQSIRIYLDPKTNLPERTVYRVDLGNNISLAAEDNFSEWKEFDGIKWPTRIITRRNGRRADDMAAVEVKFNGGLEKAELEKKP